MPTSQNLQDAFAGESQANRKYLAFAKKAQADGRPQIARLFRAAAEADIEDEGFEFQDMYPKFLAQAQAEKNQAAVLSFQRALAVEKIHHGLYTQALQTFQAGKDLPAQSIFVCPVCGNTVPGAAPDKCPVCGQPRSAFVEVK
jgi:rubrerythrin